MKIICLLSLLIGLSGCSSKPYVNENLQHYDGAGDNTVYIISHGWHTGFVIPAQKILTLIPELEQRFKGSPNIEIGWGDKGYYQAKEITSGLTLKALFWPTDTVIHAVAVPAEVESYFSNSQIEKLCLTESALSSLITFISNSINRNDEGDIVKLNRGIYGDSQFYQGVGNFFFMNTCNKWTAKGLKSAGMDISHTFKLTAGSIMDYVAQHSQNKSHLLSPCSSSNHLK